MNKAQSSAVWFQPASTDSAMQPPIALSASGLSGNASVDAIADLEMGRLVQARTIVGSPIGGPVDHAGERHARFAEQPHGLRRIGQPCGRRFLTDDAWLLAEPFAKFA